MSHTLPCHPLDVILHTKHAALHHWRCHLVGFPCQKGFAVTLGHAVPCEWPNTTHWSSIARCIAGFRNRCSAWQSSTRIEHHPTILSVNRSLMVTVMFEAHEVWHLVMFFHPTISSSARLPQVPPANGPADAQLSRYRDDASLFLF